MLWAAVVSHLFWFMGSLSDRFQPEPWGRAFVPTCTFVVLHGIYEWMFHVHNNGQTPGKDIMKLRLVTVDEHNTLGTRRAVLRWLAPGLLPLLVPLWLALGGYVLMSLPLATASRRSVYDHLANTRVVPYDRDLEDPSAIRPKARWRRRSEARERADRLAGRIR